jgi:hypothetical protein
MAAPMQTREALWSARRLLAQDRDASEHGCQIVALVGRKLLLCRSRSPLTPHVSWPVLPHDHRGAFNRDLHVCSIVTERGVNRGTRHEPITLASPIEAENLTPVDKYDTMLRQRLQTSVRSLSLSVQAF